MVQTIYVFLLWNYYGIVKFLLYVAYTFAHLIIKSDLKLFMEYCFCYKNKRRENTKTGRRNMGKECAYCVRVLSVNGVYTYYNVEVKSKVHKKLILSLFRLTNNSGSSFFLYLFNILEVFMSTYLYG